MKHIFYSFLLSFLFYPLTAQKVPEILKKEFSQESLVQTVDDIEGDKTSIHSVLKKHLGKIVVIEFWASWCKDCLLSMPETHKLCENNPQVDFIYLSLDRSEDTWKKGIEKYNLSTGDNYWFSSGWKNPFNEFIDLNWIPRYMVIDTKGKIAKYYAISAKDSELQETINLLLQ